MVTVTQGGRPRVVTVTQAEREAQGGDGDTGREGGPGW